MESLISVRNLNVHYGDMHALRDINLDIPSNKVTVILGPSGCGKSTLLKSFNRFLDLDHNARITGEVLFEGEDLYDPAIDVTDVRKRIGLLAQRPFPLPMSIYDNVAYGLRIHKLKGKGNLDGQVQHYLEMAGLWDEVCQRLHEPATKLSIGQQQRLCLARGLAVEPEILLGDEPTSALDPISAQNIERRLVDLKQRYTIVLVTHILRQARRLADFVVFMWLGELVEYGPAAEFFDHPKEERTRQYLEGAF